jgi:PAS domain S-box-containing protein
MMEPTKIQPESTVKDRLIELSTCGLAVFDLGGKLTSVNPSFACLWGYERPEEMQEMPAAQFFEKADIITGVLEKLKIMGNWSGELIAKDRDGNAFPVRATAATVKKETGELVCFVASFAAVGAGRHLLDGLRAGNENLRRFMDNIHEGLWLLDSSGETTFVNPRLADLLGYRAEDMLLKHIFYFMDVHMTEKVARYLDRCRKGFRGPIEVELLRRDGTTIETLFNAVPRLGASGVVEGIWISVEDLTSQKSAKDGLKVEVEEEKIQRQRIEMELKKRSEFYRALVHELKTPLTPIIASSDLLAEGLHEEPWLSLAKNVRSGTQNLNARIEELLDVARDELDMLRVEVGPVTLSGIIAEAAEYMKPLAESRRQTLNTEVPEALLVVRADDARIRQILLNLIGNASKYGPEGTVITVSADIEQEQALIRVRDTGKGMNSEELKHMFELYYRSPSSTNQSTGLGIGLSLCKRLIELQKGKIWVESEPGKGTVVSFTLPLEPASPGQI